MEDKSGKRRINTINGKSKHNGTLPSYGTQRDLAEDSPSSTNQQSLISRDSNRPQPAGLNVVKLDQGNGMQQGHILSAKASAIIAKYPFQTIGGLLALLLVIVAFKTFYQGKHWRAMRMAEEAFYVANEYARNNSTNLYPYLSSAFRQEVRQLPGLLPLSMQTATHGGTITAAKAVGIREITPDSVVVEVHLTFGGENSQAKHEEKCYQTMVYEKDQWRLGLTYSR